MPLILKLETTTGLLSPAGIAPSVPRAPQNVTLQFLTNSVANLLAGGAPLALKLYALGDTDTPIATFNTWVSNATYKLYTATINPLTEAGLGYLPAGTLYGRISYGDPNVDSGLFHVIWGGTGPVTGAPAPQIVITQPTGPTKQTIEIGHITGRLVEDAVEGSHTVQAAAQVTGLQLTANTAPTGADALIELVKNGVPTGSVATLSDGAKSEVTVFDPVVTVAVNDTLQFKVTQKGSTKAGGYLTVSANTELI